MERNESLLMAASYFWSDTLKAFVFGHGPTSPTLADVLMLTGLDISSPDDNHLYDHKPERKVEKQVVGRDTSRSTEKQGQSDRENMLSF